MNNFVRQEIIKDEVIEDVVDRGQTEDDVDRGQVEDGVDRGQDGEDVDQGQVKKKRKQKGWKEQGRVDNRRGRQRYDKKEGDVPCRKESCDKVFKATREMMMHMVRKHPDECTTPERLRYKDKRKGTVKCDGCKDPIWKRHLAEHKKSCLGLRKQPHG